MEYIRIDPETIALRDERFGHFLPALLAPAAFKAIGKVGKFLGGKVLGAAKAVASKVPGVGRFVKGAAEEAVAEPEEMEAELESATEEEMSDAFDVYLSDNVMLIESPLLRDLSDSDDDEVAIRLAEAMDQQLSIIRDERHPSDPVYYLSDESHPRFGHFFKKLKKIAGRGLRLVSKLTGKIPGVGSVIGAVTGAAAGLLGGGKSKPATPTAKALAPLVTSTETIANAPARAVEASAAQAAPTVAKAEATAAALEAQGKSLQEPSWLSKPPAWLAESQPRFGGYYPQLAPSAAARGAVETKAELLQKLAALEASEGNEDDFDWVTYDASSGIETGGSAARAESLRAHAAAAKELARRREVR